MAHFQIAGGFKSLIIVCSVYLVLFLTGLGLFHYANMASGGMVMGLLSAAVVLLLVFEALVLFVVGSFRISAAIRMDLTSRMIESHRLMPVPNWRAVAGYILGAGMHPICFALLNALLAYILAGVTSTSLTILTLNQVLLFSFAAMIWTWTALGTLLFRHMYFIVLAGLVLGGCLLVPAYNFLPGLALLASPFIGDSAFSFRASPSTSEWAYPMTIGAQLASIGICFAGACRLYRGTYGTTFTPLLAFLLLAAWCAVSMLGEIMWDGFRFKGVHFWMFGDPSRHVAQTIGSTIAAMVFTLVPLRTMTAVVPGKRGMPWWMSTVYLVGCVAVIGSIGFASEWGGAVETELSRARLVTFFLVGAHVVTVFLLFQLLRNLRATIAILVVCGSVLLFWIGPLFLELIRSIIAVSDGNAPTLGVIGTLSPLGLLISTWVPDGPRPSPVPGLVVQWMVAILLGIGLWVQAQKSGAPVSGTGAGGGGLVAPAVTAVAPPGGLS
jgi:hypothetical protein